MSLGSIFHGSYSVVYVVAACFAACRLFVCDAARLVCDFQLVSVLSVSFENLIRELRKLHYDASFAPSW